MQLTPLAKKLKTAREKGEELTGDIEALATCMGSDGFGYALYEGGHIRPEEWIAGEDLVLLKAAIHRVGEFKRIVESLHTEI